MIESFEARITDATAALNILNRKLAMFSYFRIILTISCLSAVTILFVFDIYFAIYATLSVYCLLFFILVSRGNVLKEKITDKAHFLRINKEEKNRLSGDYTGICGGTCFKNKDHDFSSDLDVFGDYSLFQLLCRTSTDLGKAKLASWLSGIFNITKSEKIDRQESVKELVPLLNWRQQFQACGFSQSSRKHKVDGLLEWVQEDVEYFPYKFRVPVFAFCITSTVVSITLFVLFLLKDQSVFFHVFLVLQSINYLVLFMLRKKTDAIILAFRSSMPILERYYQAILLIEQASFNSKYLLKLVNNLNPSSSSGAIKEIVRISKIFELMQLKGVSNEPIVRNAIYVIFNNVFLVDFYVLLKAEQWKKNVKNKISLWFDSISEIEVLSSISGFSYSNPEYCFPTFSESKSVIKGKDIGHPLIDSTDRVTNDFSQSGQTAIFTGSNMAGKSTFLRTVGVNIILSNTGSPVCANNFEIPHFKIFTSMRTADSLGDSLSSFKAELNRFATLREKIRSIDNNVFFIIDEPFKGTNERDRHIGIYSIIVELLEKNVFGLVATHDTRLGEHFTFAANVVNYHFSSKIENKSLVFDYKIKEGICREMNATKLMKDMGMKVKVPHTIERLL